LPKLVDAGVVRYVAESGAVEPADVEGLDPFLDLAARFDDPADRNEGDWRYPPAPTGERSSSTQ
jgi:hypothetical protein